MGTISNTPTWYNTTGSFKGYSANNGIVYTYWFTDGTFAVNVPISQGAPVVSGDTVTWAASASNGASLTTNVAWTNVTLAAAQQVYMNAGSTYNFSAGTTCTFGAGSSFNSAVTLNLTYLLGGNWLGDVIFGCLSGVASFNLTTGWKANNGAGGANISFPLGNAVSALTISAPDASQVKTFGDINLEGAGGSLVITNFATSGSPIKITGTFSFNTNAFLSFSTGIWCLLDSSAAVANGAGIVQPVPTTAQILTSASIFGATGTVILPTAAQVQNGVAFGPGGGTTGTLVSTPVGIVVGG